MLRRLTLPAALIAAIVTLPGQLNAQDHVWWEGESPAKTNFPAKTWFSASTFGTTRHRILSGGDWLTHAGKRKGPEAFATYTVHVPKTAS